MRIPFRAGRRCVLAALALALGILSSPTAARADLLVNAFGDRASPTGVSDPTEPTMRR